MQCLAWQQRSVLVAHVCWALLAASEQLAQSKGPWPGQLHLPAPPSHQCSHLLKFCSSRTHRRLTYSNLKNNKRLDSYCTCVLLFCIDLKVLGFPFSRRKYSSCAFSMCRYFSLIEQNAEIEAISQWLQQGVCQSAAAYGTIWQILLWWLHCHSMRYNFRSPSRTPIHAKFFGKRNGFVSIVKYMHFLSRKAHSVSQGNSPLMCPSITLRPSTTPIFRHAPLLCAASRKASVRRWGCTCAVVSSSASSCDRNIPSSMAEGSVGMWHFCQKLGISYRTPRNLLQSLAKLLHFFVKDLPGRL